MYATAEQALEGLRHARTKEILPTKTIARSTKLIYLDDDLVGLRFHDTIIARYERDGVRIDTRDRRKPDGWFTVTTWNRIDQFTPARTFQREGLRFMVIDPFTGSAPYDGETRLYEHGAFISPDGSCEIDLTPEQSDGILAAKTNIRRKVKRYANNVVKRWREWEKPLACCERRGEEGAYEHYFGHFRANEPVIPTNIEALASNLRDSPLFSFDADSLARELRDRLTNDFQSQFLPLAIAQIAPDFPYPQIAPRRR